MKGGGMNDQVFKAALAGLLHDVGKFGQWAGRTGNHATIGATVVERDFKTLWPPGWSDDMSEAIANHHEGEARQDIVKAVRVADWLASASQSQAYVDRGDIQTTSLFPITAGVELDKESSESNWALPLQALRIVNPSKPKESENKLYPPIFPQQDLFVVPDDYNYLWTAFINAIQVLPGPIDVYARFTGLMSVLRKYTTQIPSTTPWEDGEADQAMSDVSLYDHLKVTAAIVPCLLRLLPEDLDALHTLGQQQMMKNDRPVAQLLRVDFSGIQSFIYRIVTPERERGHRFTAKRLRGRSFYISLLTEVVADWFLRELELTVANALFIGGGRFDLLIPTDRKTMERLNDLIQLLQTWLVDQFYGVLGLEPVSETLTPADFEDLRRANFVLDEKLDQAKAQKFRNILSEKFFQPLKLEHVCAVCGLTPLKPALPDDQTCELCKLHQKIGQQLPKTAYMARLYHSGQLKAPEEFKEQTVNFEDPLDMEIILLKDEREVKRLLSEAGQARVETVVYNLNDVPTPNLTWPDKTAPAQLYLANAAPQQGNQVYEFDEIAELSTGAKLLGILKADVDHLGLIFSLGLEPQTISRTAALSHTFDRFFGGYLNTLCQTITEAWKNKKRQAQETFPENLESLFYTVYAGGDDLLIIGPWDQTVELAYQLYTDFRAYTCYNPNITLSAGISLVKPHFPVQRFVELAGEALDIAKEAGRDRITVFEEQPARWSADGQATAFDELLKLAHDLRDRVETEKMPRTLIHDLEQMRRIEIKTRDGNFKPMITPQVLYLLTRRLPKKVRDELKKPILDAWPGIRIPLSYVSLSTRKE